MRKTLTLLPILLIFIACKTVIDKNPTVQNGNYVISSDISTEAYNLQSISEDSLGSKVYCSVESYCWEFIHIRDKLYFIRSASDGKYLSLLKMSDGTYLADLSDSAKEDYAWIIQQYKRGRYKIIYNKHRVCMNLLGTYTEKERPIGFINSRNSPYEFWSIIGCEE